MVKLSRICCLLALSAGVSLAATVFSITPSPSYEGGVGLSDIAIGWTQTGTYSGVTISMILADGTPGGPLSGTEATAYLMNAVGPGTTVSNEVTTPDTVSGLSDTFSDVTLFSGLTLPAGTYYLVIDQANEYVTVQYSSGTPVEVDGTGVTDLGETAGTPAPFPPDFSPYGSPIAPTIELSITGTPGLSSVPEPAGLALTGLGLLSLGAWKLRRPQGRAY